ncbi:MAG: type II toxin-antitoxin system VapC family toxin [Burkholderiaceae bacterium]
MALSLKDPETVIAVMVGEPERRSFIEAISAADTRLVSAPTMLETGMVVLCRTGEGRLQDLRDFCARGAVEMVPFGPEHVELAVDAFRRFGKGRHPAGLDFGDCFSYALAKATGEPLLFKGFDFSQSDIKRAEYKVSGCPPALC